jgi:hypothetical protein
VKSHRSQAHAVAFPFGTAKKKSPGVPAWATRLFADGEISVNPGLVEKPPTYPGDVFQGIEPWVWSKNR